MKKIPKNIPQSSGVYLIKKRKEILYIGKAGNIQKRVESYFRSSDNKIKKLINDATSISFLKTETVIEALILEAKLIKKIKPSYNVKEKDDRSFLYVAFTKEKFPRVILVRGREMRKKDFKEVFGPFVSSSNIQEALKIIRRIFPFSAHDPKKKFNKPCFDYEIGLCPGTCINKVDRKEYLKNISNIKKFFKGEKAGILKSLKKEMLFYSNNLNFEKAEKIKRQINAVLHIRDTSLITAESFAEKRKERWEGYDISNISGVFAAGSMVVFEDGEPKKEEYRKFKIRTINKANDVGMLREVLSRRFKKTWLLPFLILVDGGKGQVSATRDVLNSCGLKIPVIGVAKGEKRNKNEFIGIIPKGINKKDLLYLRDEAHRFAINYHKKLREDIFKK